MSLLPMPTTMLLEGNALKILKALHIKNQSGPETERILVIRVEHDLSSGQLGESHCKSSLLW